MTDSSEDLLAQRRLGVAIRDLRTQRGFTRRQLEKATGLSYPYLSEIEAGKKSPSSRTLRVIADALGLEAHELMETAEAGAESRSWMAPRRSHFHESRASVDLTAESAPPLSPQGEQSRLTHATGEQPANVLFSPLEDRSPNEKFRFAARSGTRPPDPRTLLAQIANELPPEDVVLLIRLANRLRGTRR
jgi:transcriptional regulator with XRE-family HTH domain